MIQVIKFINKRNQEAIWELVTHGPVDFDTRSDWLLVGLPIGGKHKDIQWVHSSEIKPIWIKQFHKGELSQMTKQKPKRFRITYADPETNEPVTEEKEFTDGESITAREWAEDYAYAKADKGRYNVKELK